MAERGQGKKTGKSRFKGTKKFYYTTAMGLLCLFMVAALMVMRPAFFERIDRGVYDIYLHALTGGEPSPVPVVIDIDEKSLKEFGQWPWARYLFADLLIALYEYGVQAIGVDILMAEPDRTSPNLWSRQLEQQFGIAPEITGLPPELMDNDDYLASVLKQVPVIMSAQVTDNPADEASSQPRSFPITEMRAPGAPELVEFLPRGTGIIMPIPKIADASSAHGLMNAEGDSDSIFRRVPLFLAYNDTPIAGLALATLALGAGDRSVVVRISPDGPESIKVAGIDVPVSHAGTMPIAFRGAGRIIPTYSAADVINGTLDPNLLTGRIAFVGSTTAGLKDLRSTPFDNNYPGLELHAAAVDTILSERFIREPSWIPGVTFLMILLSGLLSLALFSFARPQIAFPIGAVMAAGVWFGCRYMMVEMGIYITPLYTLLSIFLQAFSAFSLRFWLEEKEKRVLRKAFANYVSPEIVGQIVESGSVSSLQGEQRNISVLFTDLRGFTSLTEKMEPTQVVSMLGSYFTPMTSIVRDSMGTLDKFVGDALMAFWNAPLDVPNHPAVAVASLVEMHKALERLNDEIEPIYDLRLRMGGGIHTGDAHVGNMGTAELMDYTAIGDTVNTASRLEGMCSKYGVGIVISGDTAEYCSEKFVLKPIDLVRVKGRKTGIPIFTVFTHEDAEPLRDELARWDEAFKHYIDGDFKTSDKLCAELLAARPEEKLYQIFAERTAAMAEHTPDNWDGVFTYESK
ncbi:adenylate/guanylate cyclase domain-containing protein [Synergistaceae bacterium OttesenSCG-928-I11]|nr:adenylate/guanylate cyclase domain-containing protein [Synergistaceae bacterium OttesenSCG-928-I11]